MSNHAADAVASGSAVHTRGAVRGGRHDLTALNVEGHVQDLVRVPTKGVHARARLDVPHLAGAVDRAGDAQITGVVKLRAADLPSVPLKGEHTPPGAYVPYFRGVVEGTGDYHVAVRVEVECDDLRGVPQQRVRLLPRLCIPELCRVVHGAGRNKRALGVEAKTHNLCQVPAERVEALAVLRVPHLTRLVEGTGDDAVAEWVVEADGVDDVLVAFEAEQLVARQRIPHLTRAVVRPRDELITALVESAVRQRQDVRAEHFEEVERLTRVADHLFREALEHLAHLHLFRRGDQGLLLEDNLRGGIEVGVGSEREEVDCFGVDLARRVLVFDCDAWRVVAEKETTETHSF
eukprot:PhM_4_TR329/c0_g1_i1/m.10261